MIEKEHTKMDNHLTNGSTIKNSKLSLDFIKDIISILQSIFTIAAIIAGTWWFFFQAEASPRVEISHSVVHRKIHNQWIWVYASISLSNVGKRPVHFNSITVWLQKILPLDKNIKYKMEQGTKIINEKGDVEWPLIGELYQSTIDIKIEPGEKDKINYEFLVPSYVKTVKLYSFLQKEGTNIGWSLASIYDLK